MKELECGLGATGQRKDWIQGRPGEVWLLREQRAKAGVGGPHGVPRGQRSPLWGGAWGRGARPQGAIKELGPNAEIGLGRVVPVGWGLEECARRLR